ncbi:methylmalonyl-CoA mutase family protein (plasmid) [Sinorhizobium meliloti]
MAYHASPLSAALGGTQSLHTNALDEAIALPTVFLDGARSGHTLAEDEGRLRVGSGNSQRRRQMAAFLKQTDRSNELLGLIAGSVVRLGSMRWIDAFAAGRCYSLLTMHSDAGVTFETRESVR